MTKQETIAAIKDGNTITVTFPEGESVKRITYKPSKKFNGYMDISTGGEIEKEYLADIFKRMPDERFNELKVGI